MKTQLIALMFAFSFTAFGQYGPADSLKQAELEKNALEYTSEEYHKDVQRLTRKARICKGAGLLFLAAGSFSTVTIFTEGLSTQNYVGTTVGLGSGFGLLLSAALAKYQLKRTHERYTNQFRP